MVHDLDIVLTLMADKVVDITARGVYSGGGRGKDYVTALLTFESGALACVTASRITENRIREMLVTSDLGCIALDYASQRIAVYKQNRPEFETGLGNYQFDLSMGRVLVRPGEPLVLELKHFVDCIVARKPPLVNGTAALEALRLVWEIQRRIELGNSFG